MQKALSIAGYGSWSLLCFLYFTWLLFPWNIARGHLLTQIDPETDNKEIRVASVRPGWLPPTLKLNDVDYMVGPKARGNSEDVAPMSSLLFLDQVKIRPKLFSLIKRSPKGKFKVDLYGGTLKGKAHYGATLRELEAELEGLDLALMDLKGPAPAPDRPPAWELKATGTADLEADFFLDLEKLKEGTGFVELEATDLVIKKLERGMFGLPETTFNTFELRFELDNGRAVVKKGTFNGDLLEAELDGHVQLNKDLARSRLSMKLKVRILDDHPRGPIIKKMLEREIRSSGGDPDGWLTYLISGRVEKPRFRPERKRRGGGGAASLSSRRGGDDEADDDADDSPSRVPDASGVRNMSEEEREERLREIREKREADREARRERIAKRRAEMLEKIGKGKGAPAALPNTEEIAQPEEDYVEPEELEELDEGLEEGLEEGMEEGLEGDMTPEVAPEVLPPE